MPRLFGDKRPSHLSRTITLLSPLILASNAKEHPNSAIPCKHLADITPLDPPWLPTNRDCLEPPQTFRAPSERTTPGRALPLKERSLFTLLDEHLHNMPLTPFEHHNKEHVELAQHEWVHNHTDVFDDLSQIDWQYSTKHSCPDAEVWVGSVKGQPLSALRGVAQFKIEKDKLLDHILNIKDFPKWMDGIAHAQAIEAPNRQEVTFIIISVKSWLTDPRFSILQSSLKRIDDKRVVISASSLSSHPLPDHFQTDQHPTMHRLEKADCRFIIEQTEGDEVRFTYDIKLISDNRFSESAQRLLNPLIPNLMKKTMSNFRRYLSDQGAI